MLRRIEGSFLAALAISIPLATVPPDTPPFMALTLNFT